MAVYTDLPDLHIDFLNPARAAFDNVGASTDGGRNGLGEGITFETTGGGIVTATYEECKIIQPEQYEYINYLGARLNGSFRFINAQIITDFYGPIQKVNGLPGTYVTGITHSDGATFSDGSGYSQATTYGELLSSAAMNAGVISIQMFGASRPLRWSDWFSIYHTTKGWRAYRYWEIQDQTDDTYKIAIQPPLREAVAAGTRLEFARPRCAMKLTSGSTIPSIVEAFHVTRSTIQLTEAF